MAEHERASMKKQEEVDQTHRSRQQQPQPSSDALHAWDQGRPKLNDIPFRPQTDQHAWLVRTHSGEQLADIVLDLQQLYGNTYVQGLLRSVSVQAKLKVNPQDDVYEHEADRVAEVVTRGAVSQTQRQSDGEEEGVQTKDLNVKRREVAEEEEEQIQTQLAKSQPVTIDGKLESRINAARFNGQPMTESVRSSLEPQFGIDFSDMKIHDDSEADEYTVSRHGVIQRKLFIGGEAKVAFQHDILKMLLKKPDRKTFNALRKLMQDKTEGNEAYAETWKDAISKFEQGEYDKQLEVIEGEKAPVVEEAETEEEREQREFRERQQEVISARAKAIIRNMEKPRLGSAAREILAICREKNMEGFGGHPLAPRLGQLLKLIYSLYDNAAYLKRAMTGERELKNQVNIQLAAQYAMAGNIYDYILVTDDTIEEILQRGVIFLNSAWDTVKKWSEKQKVEYIFDVFDKDQGYNKLIDSIQTYVASGPK